MNNKINILAAKNAFISALILAAISMALLAPRAAVNVDENLHYPHAKKVVNWYFTGGGDSSCLETPVTNLKYYGQSVDNFTALINRIFTIENEYFTRHITGAVFFWLLLLFSGLIGYKISQSYWVSALTVISLLLMPRLFGQAFGNLKDIPFATGYAAGVYFIIRFLKEMPRPRWSTAIWLGFAIAFTCSVRIGGLILLAYLALFSAMIFIILKPFAPKQKVSTKPCLVRLLGQGLVIGTIGYFAGLVFWPFALQDVFRNPLESLGVMEHYKVSIRQVFEGNLVWSTNLPWYYLPKWLLISTPEFIFLGILFYAVYFIKTFSKKSFKQLFPELFLFFTLLFPLIYVIIIDSNLYSGVRQLLFALPMLAIISAHGIYSMWSSNINKKVKIPVAVLLCFMMALPLKHLVITFPADYIYFNAVSGGNKAAWSNFEYDYYFHGLKEPSEYVVDLVGDKNAIVASNCNLFNYYEKPANIAYKYTRYLERSSSDWDYALFGVNYIHPELLKNGNWMPEQIEKIFYHKGNPIAIFLKRNSKSDYTGIKELKANNLEKAKTEIETSLKTDKNNVWLYVQLAKISLKQNDFEGFKRYLQKGRDIYPFYEPFYLLEAQYLYSAKKYSEAKGVLEELKVFNPRYGNAAPLLKAVNKKLNI